MKKPLPSSKGFLNQSFLKTETCETDVEISLDLA